MTSKFKTFGSVGVLIALLSVSAFAGKKPAVHTAVGTIASMTSDQIVVNEKVKGKDQPVIYRLEPSTQKSGNLQNGSFVTVQYHSDKTEKFADTIRERSAKSTETKSGKKSQKS